MERKKDSKTLICLSFYLSSMSDMFRPEKAIKAITISLFLW